MAKILKNGIGASEVGGAAIRLESATALRSRNNAGSGDINWLLTDASDNLVFQVQPQFGSDPTSDNHLSRKKWVDDNFILTSLIDANNGVAGLDGSGLIPVALLPTDAMIYKGAWAASTNTPALANGTGTNGDLYRASDAGSVNFGAGAISFVAGDAVIYNGSIYQKIPGADIVLSVNSQTGVVVLDTDDISEGTALYFTTARARTAAVDDTAYNESSWSGVVDQAPSKNALRNKFESISALATQFSRQKFTLIGTDITNGYVDLAEVMLTGSEVVWPEGEIIQNFTDDYTILLTGGAGGKTRITFAGDLLALVATDVLYIKYAY